MVYNTKGEFNIEHILKKIVTNTSVYRLLFPKKKVEITFFLLSLLGKYKFKELWKTLVVYMY